MKFIALALFFVATHVSAQSLEATVALKQVLGPGHYTGVTPEGVDCAFNLSTNASGLTATAMSEGQVISRHIDVGSIYRWNPGTRYFLSSERVYSRDGINSVETVFRTLAVEEMTQYVVVARVIVRNTEVREDKVECIIDLH